MKILRTYVLKEHAGPFFVTMGGLTAVLLIGNIVRLVELVVARGVSVFDIIRLILYLIPYMLAFTVPMACLIAMVLAFGRLSTDYELIAMRASGVAPWRLVSPMLAVGLLISMLLVVVNDQLVPASHLAFRRQLKAIGIKQPTAYLEAGTFIKDFPPYIIFIYQVDRRKLYGVRIYEPQPNGPTRTIIADSGEFERLPDKRGVQLKLYDGSADEWDPLRPGSFDKVTFGTYAINLRSSQDDPEKMGKKLKELTFKELLGERAKLAAEGINTTPVSLEFHRKVASSFAALVFVAFGLALGLRLDRHEKLMSYVWVLAIFMSYYLFTVGMNAIALKGWVAPSLAMWMPNLAGAAIAGGLVWRAVRR
jgi:lipopolysaccharide export system permease protein